MVPDTSSEIHHPKAYIIQHALENYLEEKSDLLIAMSRIEKGEETISLDEIDKKYNISKF